jgi:hypothetical protein
MIRRRPPTIVAITAVAAVGVPLGAAVFVQARTSALAGHLGAAAEQPVTIGDIDADLTGTIRLSDVSLGTLFAADRVEASVALDSLLAGQLSADEIRIAGPRIAVDVTRDGDSDLARVVRRLAERRRKSSSSPSANAPRIRRIVVSSGTLTARIAGVGEVAADGVELVPDENGVRVITGTLRLRGKTNGIDGELLLARSAAEVSLPHVKFGRVLAVGGTGTLHVGNDSIALRDVGIGRLRPGGALELHGALDDHGIPRTLGVDLIPPHDGNSFALAVHGQRIPLGPFAALAPHALDISSARVSGDVVVRRTGGTVELDVDGSIAGLRVDQRAIAPQPVPVSASIDARVAISPHAVAVDHATLTVGAATWTLGGWLRRGTPVSGQLDIALATAPCADLLTSLPQEIRGPLDGLTMTGTFGGHARIGLDLAAPLGDGVTIDTDLANQCRVAAEPPAADVTTLAQASEHVFPDGSRALIGPDEPQYFPLKRLPYYVAGAFTSAEDGRFYEHHGFDVTQIARSFEIDLRDRRLARGGSTISQQLIKNSFLTQRRSFDRKVQEAVLTWRLESRLDKKQILERYFQIIELGPHIFGLRAAAAYWFNLSPRELTIKQAAFLAALTSEPTSMSRRIRKVGGLDTDSAARVDVILRAMTRDGVISRDELDEARRSSLRFSATALRSES